jgi:hypothetical protein
LKVVFGSQLWLQEDDCTHSQVYVEEKGSKLIWQHPQGTHLTIDIPTGRTKVHFLSGPETTVAFLHISYAYIPLGPLRHPGASSQAWSMM